jgi:predicted glycosyltransferase
MNREAAALGVPVYSIFRGTLGAVDKCLAESGRLTLLATPADVRTRIALVHRNSDLQPKLGERRALHVIVENIVSLVESNGQRASQSCETLARVDKDEPVIANAAHNRGNC